MFDRFASLKNAPKRSSQSPETFISFRSLHFGILGFKSEQYLARWISAYSIYGDDQRGLLILKFIRFVQLFFGVLFSYYSYYRTAKKRSRSDATDLVESRPISK